MPQVEVHFALSGGSKWGGIAEPAGPPVAPAVANAIYYATGEADQVDAVQEPRPELGLESAVSRPASGFDPLALLNTQNPTFLQTPAVFVSLGRHTRRALIRHEIADFQQSRAMQ